MSPKSPAFAMGFLTVALVSACLAQSSTKPQTYREILAARQAPDLATLIQRSSPQVKGEDASESFWDLLKLRESPNADAVPILERVLIENLSTNRIHRFAAVQALFSIGTPRVHQILAQQVLAKETRADLAIDYTSHWEMQEPQRSRYIQAYLLKNNCNDLIVEIKPSPTAPRADGRVNLVITIRNASNEAFHVLDQKTFPGEMLFLHDAKGQYLPRIRRGTMCKDQSEIIELKPGQPHSVNVTVDVAAIDPEKRPTTANAELRATIVESGHYCNITAPGRVEVLALFEAEPLTDERRQFLKVDQDWKWWTGRAVSKPLSIHIAPSGTIESVD